MTLELAAGLLIVGALWALQGWRGKRVGDHPFCRRCGFDLFGLPAGSTACSECGADVQQRKAVQIGHRVRRTGRLTLGLALLIPAGLYLGMMAYGAWNPAAMLRQAPAWWLAWQVDSASRHTRHATLDELSRRMAAGTLGQANVNRVAGLILEAQGNAKRTWDPAWGDFMERAGSLKLLKRDDWKRYARQATEGTLWLKVRPMIHPGDALPLELGNKTARQASQTRLWLHGTVVGVHLDQATVANAMPPALGGIAGSIGWITQEIPPAWLARLEQGPHRLTLTLKIDVTQGAVPAAALIVSYQTELDASFVVVSANTPTVTPITDSSLRQAVKRSLMVLGFDHGPSRMNIQISANQTPVDLAYELWVRTDKQQWKLGGVSFPKGAKNFSAGFQDGHSIPSRFDVILKPSAAVAESTVDLTSYWNHEIIFRNVAVEDGGPLPPGASWPATRPISQATTRPRPEKRPW